MTDNRYQYEHDWALSLVEAEERKARPRWVQDGISVTNIGDAREWKVEAITEIERQQKESIP